MTRRLDSRLLLALPAVLVVTVFFVLPYLNLLYISFLVASRRAAFERVFTLQNYAATILDRFTWEVVWRTLWLGGLTTLAALCLAYPIAYQLARAPHGLKGLLMVLIISPLLLGVVIRSTAG